MHRLDTEKGQATAEYALVMIAAASIAVALIVWATTSDVLPGFFNSVIQRIISMV
jgi:Protein of unknown function (DUF4244)